MNRYDLTRDIYITNKTFTLAAAYGKAIREETIFSSEELVLFQMDDELKFMVVPLPGSTVCYSINRESFRPTGRYYPLENVVYSGNSVLCVAQLSIFSQDRLFEVLKDYRALSRV